MHYGVSFYPEHKGEEEIAHDLSLMADAGINVVRMGEFAWCRFEPAEGDYRFDWLDRVVDRLGALGIASIICTPTACPPAWLVRAHPEVLYQDNRGVIRPFGGRRLACYNNPLYRDYSERIATEIGRHCGSSPNVLGFQIDNELAQEGTGRCHCPVCREGFQQWLARAYGSIQALNVRMGTVFWSQEYDDFGQIEPPISTIEVAAAQPIQMYYDNPSLRLAFERFASDSLHAYQKVQADALRRHTNKTVTTNATGLATNSIDYYRSFADLDVYAYDLYPNLREGAVSSFSYAHARGVKGKPFWVLEFASGGGHRLGGSGRLQPFPGALKQAAIHAFACGADLLAHFQLRTFPFGAEQLNYAIVDLDGIPRRRFREMKEAARELRELEPLLAGTRVSNQVALCFDYDSLWATGIKPISHGDFDYVGYCTELYEALLRVGIGVDVVPFTVDFAKYPFVVVPAPFVMREETRQKLIGYVRDGGTLVSTFLAAAKNEDNVGLALSLPCGLTGLFGITVAEVEPVFRSNVAGIRVSIDGETLLGANKHWAEVLEPTGAELVGTYADTFRKGQGVISRNRCGKGTAYYVGTGLSQDLRLWLLAHMAAGAGVRPAPFVLPSAVEAVTRTGTGRALFFLFNFRDEEVTVELSEQRTEVQTGRTHGSRCTIPARGYVALH